jgi:hypothetical protein
MVRRVLGVQFCVAAVAGFTSGLAGISAPASLDQEKGRVR